MMPAAAPRSVEMRDEPTSDDQLRAVREAYRTRVRRFGEARWRMADRVADAERRFREYRERADARIADLEAQNADLRKEVAGKDQELRTVMSTKTFRYSARLRQAYGWLRGRGRR
jgi:hypothetical protein